MIYFILEEDDRDWRIKIGRAKDIKARQRNLQTGNSRQLLLLGWIDRDDDAQVEKALHRKYADSNVGGSAREWFYLDPTDILEDLQSAGRHAFVAKNKDAFEIVGHDSDAVPEYMRVWNWASFELEVCCPFCGCLGGMHFQDASQMYYCINCQEHTDFSDLNPSFDSEEEYLEWKERRDRQG